MGFIPRSDREKQEMLEALGMKSVDELLADIPAEVRLQGDLDLPPPLSEPEARDRLWQYAQRNAGAHQSICFAGGGAYDHFIPSVVDHLSSRPEFYTAYTPYQPEVSQGTLQSIYEFQSLIARLTGMEIANASLYDGATALAEAVLMAHALNRKHRVVVSGCASPLRLGVLRSYLQATDLEIKVTDPGLGWTDPAEVAGLLGDDTCCLVVDNPNFFGVVEDGEPLGKLAHEHQAIFIVEADPVSLGLLAPPSAYGADLVVGEGQALGNRLSFGGPYLGFMATRKQFIRKLPGRIVGKTVDTQGKVCFCLTLQTREQHIRRAKATSNICTNQALMALRAAIYLTWLGKEGLQELARLCLSKAVYARKTLAASGFKLRFDRPFFREFVVDVPGSAQHLVENLAGQGTLAGVALGSWYPGMTGSLLLAFTEKRTKAEIDRLVEMMKQAARTAEVRS